MLNKTLNTISHQLFILHIILISDTISQELIFVLYKSDESTLFCSYKLAPCNPVF